MLPKDVLGMDVDEQIAKTVFVIEATDFERHMLWREWHDKIDWQEVSRGFFRQIGEIDGRPICVCVTWACINGQLVCFYDATSEVVDYAAVKSWRDNNFHALRGTCDAWNFHHCVAAVEEASK